LGRFATNEIIQHPLPPAFLVDMTHTSRVDAPSTEQPVAGASTPIDRANGPRGHFGLHLTLRE